MHIGWHAINWRPVTGWFNLLLFGHVSYTIVDIVLRNGKKLQYVIDDHILKKDIKKLFCTPTDMQLLAEMCSLSVAERSKEKCKRELLRPRTIKTFENIDKVCFTTFYRHKNFDEEHENYFKDKSVEMFTHTWIEEIDHYQFDYANDVYAHTRNVYLQAVEPSEQDLYITKTYTVSNETNKDKLF